MMSDKRMLTTMAVILGIDLNMGGDDDKMDVDPPSTPPPKPKEEPKPAPKEEDNLTPEQKQV